jgi:hypothetical protein
LLRGILSAHAGLMNPPKHRGTAQRHALHETAARGIVASRIDSGKKSMT